MRYFVIFLILIGFTGFIIPQVFGTSENLFSGTATFERLPVTISPNTEAKFEIKFQYTEGAYSLSNVTAIADITPKGAASFVHFDAEPFDVYQNSIVRIPVTISIDPGIEYEKIFLNISYVGTGINDASFKSSWSDSIMFDIIPNEMTEISLNNCNPVDLESAISNGILQLVCHSSMTNSVRAIINADSDGTVTLEIPKFLLYSLTDSQCNVSNDFLVLVKGREVVSEIIDNKNTNSVTLDFAKGITEIEIMGTTILPDPSPAQYCGIVEGYEKQFLAPLDQTDRGVKPEFIRCNVGLVSTQRIDDSPVCVKPQTLQKLRERGWAEPLGDIVFQRPSQTKSEPTLTPHSEPEPDYNFDKTFTLIGKKSKYNLDYLMPSGTITDIKLDCNSLQLVLSVSSTESGILTLLLPEEIIGNIETILVDKIQWNYISYAGNTVTVMIPENTKTIEIKGSYRDSLSGGECR